MHQASLWETAARHAPFLGGGSFGQVHALDDDWVIKRGKKDGTLNYLEWCFAEQKAGRYLKGMPVIDYISHLSTEQYVVAMERLRTRDDGLTYDEMNAMPRLSDYCEGAWGDLGPTDFAKKFGHNPLIPSYMAALFTAWRDYAVNVLGMKYGAEVNDCHKGNTGYNKAGELVLFDPSASDYVAEHSESGLEEFTLQ